MNPANKAKLEEYRQYWLTLKNAGYMMGLSGNVRDNMVRIMGEEFRPGYTADLWCPPCVADMVTALYFEFEKWEAAQPVPEPESPAIPEIPIIPALEEGGVPAGPELMQPIDPEPERDGFDEATLTVEEGELTVTREEEPKPADPILDLTVEPSQDEPVVEPPVIDPAKPAIKVKSNFPSHKSRKK
jgi:hypothetical protein